jgi:hypothetical protein
VCFSFVALNCIDVVQIFFVMICVLIPVIYICSSFSVAVYCVFLHLFVLTIKPVSVAQFSLSRHAVISFRFFFPFGFWGGGRRVKGELFSC